MPANHFIILLEMPVVDNTVEEAQRIACFVVLLSSNHSSLHLLYHSRYVHLHYLTEGKSIENLGRIFLTEEVFRKEKKYAA
jgi:hypothetical protein